MAPIQFADAGALSRDEPVVGDSRSVAAALLMVVAIAAAAVWVLVPRMHGPSFSAYAKLPLTALTAFRSERGYNPKSFVETESYLEGLTRSDCRIIPEGGSKYRVEMPIKRIGLVVVEVLYSAKGGSMETYNVRRCYRKRSS